MLTFTIGERRIDELIARLLDACRKREVVVLRGYKAEI
jgi:hypothetical protein